MDKYLMDEFRTPGTDKRSIPFWSWNGKMDPEEVKSQIIQMKEAGVGGFFIHSRIGLETEYLGTDWMNCVTAAVVAAKEQGLHVWLYDEDRWPSGTAGGRVTSCGDAYRCKGLTLEVLDVQQYEELYREEILSAAEFNDNRIGLLAAYRAVTRGEHILDFHRLDLQEENTFQEGEVLLAVRLEVSAPSAWFNNETPPDNLNPDCVKRFLLETHEKYKKVIGAEFGKTVKGIFTDEPSLNDRFAYFGEKKSWIPWTFGFGDYLKKETGYDFFEVLPFFYFHAEESLKIRHDYWHCITKRYKDSYFRVIGDWCKENNLKFTGHMLHEDSMGICTRVNGAVMPNYQHMDVPGIDMLCEQTEEYMTVKQCTSVAHQLGRKQVLTETYGCTGWDFTFEGQKWMGDWQYVLGVNRRCQHLMLYSLRGCRKRDYPPNFNYNTNWWKYNTIVEDYFARLSVVLEKGEPVRDILLIHPASTAWSRLGVNPYGNPTRDGERDVPALDAYGQEFNKLIEHMERRHLDVDLGDEILIRQYGKAVSGRFIIENASYRAVVLPPMDTLLRSTCEKLLEYMEQGGTVYAMTPGIYAVEGDDGHPDIYGKMLTHKNWLEVMSKEELLLKLETYRSISIRDHSGKECTDVLYQLRKDEDEYYLFLVNNNRCKELEVAVELPLSAALEKMNLLCGTIEPVDTYENTETGIRFRVRLEKTGSSMFYLNTNLQRSRQTQNSPAKRTRENTAGCVIKPEGPYDYSLDHKNVLTLDRCRYRLGDGGWSGEMEVWEAQKEIRTSLEMRQIISNGIEQRYRWITEPHLQDGARTELAFRFWADCDVKEVFLAVERPEEFRFFLNGEEVIWKTEGYLLDKEIKKSRMPEIRCGENELILVCSYRNDMELEMIYLEGVFGVNERRHLTELPKKLSEGSWTEQGLKHYCGSVTYHLEYISEQEETVYLQLPPIKAICVEVIINGQKQLLPWNFEQSLCISPWIGPGKNRIDIVVVGSPRNMMGPFHLKEKPYNTNPGSFCVTGEEYSEEYQTVSYGIMEYQ